ncbi:TolC family protein, partial [Pediococcus acidilactici]|uniref:TolC family protein n=1 Tax=Pediococcus acidilactici TaxID=1254 RepID=UPI00300DA038
KGIGPSRELTSQSSNDVAQSANTYWRAQLNIAYEADLFGRVSDAIKASTADEQQSAALYHSVLLALQADVAANYYQLRTLDAQISIYRDTLKLREDALAFATKRKDSGQVSEMDWMRAQTELASTRAGELALVRARAAREHNLAVLLGQAPSAFDFPFMPVQPLTVE